MADSKAKIETLKEDAKDAADELKNRAQAGLHNAKAEFDKAKRDVRHEADKDPAAI